MMKTCSIVCAVVAAVMTVPLNRNGLTDALNWDDDVTSSVRIVVASLPVPSIAPLRKGGGTYRVGDPYAINGRTYTPREEPTYSAEGVASWYGDKFHGRLTANGEIFDTNALSAAHPTLPLPSYVRVTNLQNHRSLIVRLNDRGPYHDGRLIDVSVRTAKLLGFYDQGIAPVRVEYIGLAELDGSDDKSLAGTLRDNNPSAPETTASTPIASVKTSARSGGSLGIDEFSEARPSMAGVSLIEIPH